MSAELHAKEGFTMIEIREIEFQGVQEEAQVQGGVVCGVGTCGGAACGVGCGLATGSACGAGCSK